MSVRKTGTVTQTLRWDSRNQLAQVSWGSPVQNEYYGYDENGRRIARAQVSGAGTTVTYYPFAHYEQMGGSSGGVNKYYFFTDFVLGVLLVGLVFAVVFRFLFVSNIRRVIPEQAAPDDKNLE